MFLKCVLQKIRCCWMLLDFPKKKKESLQTIKYNNFGLNKSLSFKASKFWSNFNHLGFFIQNFLHFQIGNHLASFLSIKWQNSVYILVYYMAYKKIVLHWWLLLLPTPGDPIWLFSCSQNSLWKKHKNH